ncbi:MAG: tRNA (cytidine(34)-2'-O)-methyltransferase [Peptococcaceae bacterium]|nr:tRNA (cytidine(34)-2'-O)-methyltransferase [Peptococcaceae bacterium]
MAHAMHIVLVEPEIPQNTGNVVRLCSALGAVLHLVKPLGFRLEDKYLKRAGLDYWPLVELIIHEDFAAFEEKVVLPKFLATTKGDRRFDEVRYNEACCLLFGSETKGLSEDVLRKYPKTQFRLPMRRDCRCLNLSNSVAVSAYEVMRQWGYPNLF